jgi:SAM-dependent methyltransferase
MPDRSAFGLRAIDKSRVIERIYSRLNSIRSLTVLAFASDATLDAFNASAYGTAERYDPESLAYVSSLYPWEEEAIDRYFPTAPARILVGGAGAGREPLALAERGYQVTAFEPVAKLAEAMAKRASETGDVVRVYRGSYRDLPHLESAGGQGTVTLASTFDAAIIGWGSFSHLYTERGRIEALTSMASLTEGPILASFIATRPEGDAPASRLRSWLVQRRDRHPADRFSISMGFQHPVNEQEVRELAAAVDLEVVALEFSGAALAPHVVLTRR